MTIRTASSAIQIALTILSVMGMVALGCDRDKPSNPAKTGSVRLSVDVPASAPMAGVPAKAVVKEARVTLSGPKMDERSVTIQVTGGEAKGQIADVPVGQVSVELALVEEGDIPLWQGSALVEVRKGQTANASIELQRAGDEPPQADFQFSPEGGQPGTEFTFTAHVSDRHDQAESLEVRWDTNGDGSFDTDWSDAKELRRTYGEAGTYSVRLEVRDKTQHVAEAAHPILVVLLLAQTGDAPGADYLEAPLAAGTVQLDGRGSAGPESGELVYHWSQILDYPGAKSASIMGSLSDNHSTSAASVFFRPDLGAGLYVMTLEVEAPGFGARSAPDTLFVTVVSNAPGSVVPSSPWSAVVGDVILLQGEASDPDGDELQYRWRGERVDLLSDSTSQAPYFTAAEVGKFIYHFVAIDTDPQEGPPAIAIVQVAAPGPIASFRAEPSTGTAPLSVVFTNESEFGERFSWAFGDGETSTQQHPDIHVYHEIGQYEVVLQVVGTEARVATEKRMIVVSDVDRPDVIVNELVLVDAAGEETRQVNEGDLIGFRVRVRNTGAATANGVLVRLWLDGEEVQGVTNSRIDLGPQEESTQRLVAEWSARPGQHGLLVSAVVEGGGQPEANPDNNSKSLDFAVNSQPVAVAGDDLEAVMGDQVSLDGGGSSDLDGDALSHQWSQVSGPVVRIVSGAGAKASILVAAVGQHVFRLVVSDGKMESEPDEMVVTVRENDGTNRPPVADAGPDQQVQIGETVVLDGSGSSDPGGRAIEAWSWTQTGGPEAGLSAEEPWRLSFEAKEAGDYRFELVVHDDEGEASPPDEVVVEVLAPDDYPVETITVDLPGGATMDFVWIEPGTFMMGSPETELGRNPVEGPQHEVTITQGFWLAKYTVTQEQWEAVAGTSPWSGQRNVQANTQHPAVYVSWEDVQGFVSKLNTAGSGSVFRLPTEAEWEYACRAGTSTRWSFGDDEARLPDYGWYDMNAANAGLQYAQPVGMLRSNPWGLHDMHGNAWEWVQDRYGAYTSTAQTDPRGPSTGVDRVRRGGHFGDPAANTRSAKRNNTAPDGRYYNIGARLVRMAGGNAPPVADAGADQVVELGAVVQLDGTGSLDADGDILSYAWSIGTGISLSSTSNPRPQFSASTVGSYAIALVVNDGQADSAPDTVVVTVKAAPQKPVADAGELVFAEVGETVQLDGSGSLDPDGGGLTYLWTAPEEIELSDATAERPRFVVPGVGGHRLELVVSNGALESDPAEVWVVAHELVLVPAGEFTMGWDGRLWEEPAHQVYLDGYSIDKYEATNSQYEAFLRDTGRSGSRSINIYPVTQVSWYEAVDYCEWAGMRLPTEAEWEKAARGTEARMYPWGDGLDRSRANYGLDAFVNGQGGQDDSDGYLAEAPVGSYPSGASPYGALDMAGNVMEWTLDWFGDNYYAQSPTSNPTGPPDGTVKSLRSGTFMVVPDMIRTTRRHRVDPSTQNWEIGFRCVRGRDIGSSANTPPKADAGPDQTVTVGQLVQLVGAGSSDVDDDGLRWAWSELSGNPAMGVLSDTTGRDPWFTPDVPGVYTFRLEVWDGWAADTDEVVVTVEDAVWEPVFVTVTTPAGTEHELALVPEGEFTMGSVEEQGIAPPHQVYLSEYYIDLYEVTNEQYNAYVSAEGVDPARFIDDPQLNSPDQPVAGVSWFQANDYCEWAGFRLPTEAEWEKAARGTDGRTYPWGEGVDRSKANWGVDDQSPAPGESTDDSDGYLVTAPVGSYPDGVSPYGVHNMAGNLIEWVADWHDDDYYRVSPYRDPRGPDQGTKREMRGGSFQYGPLSLRTYNRGGYWEPTSQDWHNGFRCATTKPNSAPRASAGADQEVVQGEVGQLDGSGSSDPDGDFLSYRWSAPTGLALSSTSNVRPQFVAGAPGMHRIALVVNDGTVNSLADTVVVTITAPNTRPIADAGRHAIVEVGETVQLSGSGSSDADGDALEYEWSVPEGVRLSDTTAEHPRFSVPSIGAYWFRLTVSDGQERSDPDSVAVVAHELVLVPAGDFVMGSDTWAPETRPAHGVYLDPYYIGKFEVTNSQYGAFTEITGAHEAWHLGDASFEDLPLKPRIGVTWEDAAAYCEWAGMRLPTEAEWEKAARGTDGRTYPWGEGLDDTRAIYDRFRRGITPYSEAVGSYPTGASPYGALDMTGNVSEWVADWFSATYYQTAPANNPTGPGDGSERVWRGGGWNDPSTLQTFERGRSAPDARYQSIGIRCARAAF